MLNSGDITNILTHLKDGGVSDDDILVKKLNVMKDQLDFDQEVRERAAEIRKRANELMTPKE